MINQVDASFHELVRHGTPDFPFAFYNDSYAYLKDLYFYLHYHDEFEIVFCVKGDMKFLIDGEEVLVDEGGMILVNSNVLHQVCHSSYPSSKINTLVFSSKMFSLFPGSLIETKYLNNLYLQNFTCLVCSPSLPYQKKVIDEFASLRQYICKPDFYEIGIHITLLKGLEAIVSSLEHMTFIHKKNKVDNRIRKAIDFISSSYSESITLEDIASSINLSPSECCKLFKKTMNTSPITYLTMHRINMARSLLQDFNLSITEVALQCGFSSSNYFTITFKKLTGMTPRDYQNKIKTK
ncbi:MAG: AraC family transcriptional regulator [Bacilli bacterium]